MTLRHLKIYVTICQTGSTKAAGEKLYIAQPSISLALSELENHYGTKFFDRIGKRLHITHTGREFLQYAIHIVELMEQIEQELKNSDSKGEIRIGASVTIGNCLLVDYIKEFSNIYPEISVKVIIANSENIAQMILENKIDLGLVESHIDNGYLIQKDFCDDELVFICSKNHSFANETDISLDDFINQPILLREVGSAGRSILENKLKSLGYIIKPQWESSSTQAIIEAVKGDIGVAFLPLLLVKDEIDNENICCFKINDLEFFRTFKVIYHKNKYISNSAETFIQMLIV